MFLKGFFSRSDSHKVHSFTRKMHDNVKRESRARHRAEGNNADSEDAEEEFKGEMDNFQDLQLGSITPVVRHEAKSLRPSLT